MKKLIIFISFLIFTIIACKEIDREKYELIKAIVENPIEYESIVKNSKFFKKDIEASLFGSKRKQMKYVIDCFEKYFHEKQFNIYDIEENAVGSYIQDVSGTYTLTDDVTYFQLVIITNGKGEYMHFRFRLSNDSLWTLVWVDRGKGNNPQL
ncbi:MAG: hypothetical protein V1779_11300 [bacterium]